MSLAKGGQVAGPLEGIKVVELGFWVAGPSCAGILADWGADVVKVEPLTGDPFRGMTAYFAVATGQAVNPPFELDNRGKRSIGLDYGTDRGRTVLLQLIEQADVFVTNLRVDALERAGIDQANLVARFPRLVYASITGLGLDGAERERPAYDVGSFWSRAGVAAALTPEGAALPYQRGGMGDHMTGLAAAGAVAVALFTRERTGVGQVVSTSLLRIGSYMMGWDLNINLRTGSPTVAMTRTTAPNPLIVDYAASDGKRFWLLGLEGNRHWPALLRAVDRPDLADDPRFAELFARAAHAAELVALLDEVFATRSRAEWAVIFDREGVWWAPVQATHDLLDDAQAAAAGCFVDVPDGEGTARRGVATPVDFSGSRWAPSGPSPELGQHTEEVLLELGYDWDAIIDLKEAGAVC
jgi:crotonobetainyl-CoA:carnitine CoA-transferase CaiB-like acyl-CoA transferase